MNRARENALTNLSADAVVSWVPAVSESSVSRAEERPMSSMHIEKHPRDDKTRRNTITQTYQAAERCSFPTKQSRIGGPAQHLNLLRATHHHHPGRAHRQKVCTGLCTAAAHASCPSTGAAFLPTRARWPNILRLLCPGG